MPWGKSPANAEENSARCKNFTTFKQTRREGVRVLPLAAVPPLTIVALRWLSASWGVEVRFGFFVFSFCSFPLLHTVMTVGFCSYALHTYQGQPNGAYCGSRSLLLLATVLVSFLSIVCGLRILRSGTFIRTRGTILCSVLNTGRYNNNEYSLVTLC